VTGVIICPSNPWLSVAPILAVPALKRWLQSARIPVVAVSPIIGGQAVKGPAAKIMCELGAGTDTLGIVAHYGDRVQAWVIDEADAALAGAIRNRGARVAVTQTLMTTPEVAAALARTAIKLLHELQ
jgi:LPPG:FO 2-phospho-L-lactate transferase